MEDVWPDPRWIYLEELHSLELDLVEWAEKLLGREITEEENSDLEKITFTHLDQFCTGYRNYN